MKLLPRLLILGALLLVIAGIGAWIATRPDVATTQLADVTGKTPKLTAVRPQAIPTVRIADVVGWPADTMPTPAAGLAVNAFATGLAHPRWLYELANGDVLVAETNSPARAKHGIADYVMGVLMKKAGAGVPSANRITLLRDTNGDGVADMSQAYITGLNSPLGMALLGDRLYIANTDSLVWFPYDPRATSITAKPTLVARYPGGGNHWARSLLPSPNGRDLLVGVGSSSNIGENGLDRERNRADILEISPVNGGQRVYTAGLRNPQGLAVGPEGRVWTVVNERDQLGSDMVPDYLALVDFGAFYGWPYTYWGGYPDKRVEARPDLQPYTRRPDYALGPHTASLGLAWGSLGSFANGMFVGQHGSWNRVPVSGYKVVFVPFNAHGFPDGAMRDVLTGFLDAKGDARGRPVGVITRKAGDLLVADDVGNRIWRVTAAGARAKVAAR